MDYQSLDGRWHMRPTDSFHEGVYSPDPAAWAEQELPAHWQQHPLFEQYVGRMVYRRQFQLDRRFRISPGTQAAPRRVWLRLDGVFYFSRPWLNGRDLGLHEGYFIPQEHEVGELLREDNELIVEIECPDEHSKTDKRLITGVFSHWDCIDPQTNPGGIWRPVSLISTGPTRIKQLLLDTGSLDEAEAQVRFRATFDAAQAGLVRLRWTITPKNFAGAIQIHTQELGLQTGLREYSGTFGVRDPQLWWTHDLGQPNCYTIRLELLQGGEVSDTHQTTYGIRRFELRNWLPHLNGVRFLIKGNNYAPGDTRIASMTAQRCERDLELARACHMNLLRVHAHIDTPALYEAANLAGMLLWQDFPLQWLYGQAVLPEAERQARQMVRLLYNHPAIVIWCMHNEAHFTADTKDERAITKARQYATSLGWNWNREVLDTRLKRAAEQEDRSRPVVRSSGEYAIPGVRAGTDTHFYHGWYTVYGKLRQWEGVAKRFPANLRFVTEFGAQSFPNLESCVKFMDGEIDTIDWQHLGERHQFQGDMLAHWIDWRAARSLPELIDQTQRYQSELNRFYIDRLRHRKYRPTGGIVPFMFHDPNPAVQWSIVDYWRVPKASYQAMRLAFSPQYAYTILEAERFSVKTPVDLPVYLVNDAQQPAPVRIVARLLDPQGRDVARSEREA
ncbi:MAG: glycoside hydrolase, partial [Roseiflexaceae bacterium]|nr:glycoside hydrolase [Roseiflexaceae bacterium]